jgi:hypothetical protein
VRVLRKGRVLHKVMGLRKVRVPRKEVWVPRKEV